MTRKRRVLVITPDFPPARGGIQVLTHRLVSCFRRVEPLVVALGESGAEVFDAQQHFAVRRTPTPERLRPLAMLGLNAGSVAVAKGFRPHGVMSMHIVGGPAAAFLRRWTHVPVAQYLHAKEVGGKPGLARFAVTRADVVIGVSRYTCELARGVGAQDGKIRRINNGVDVPDSLAPRREGRPTILTIARLEDRYKGHDVMLRALPLVRAQIPDVHWVVVGDGPLRQVLEPLAHGLGVNGAVHFAGSVSDVERDAWLGRADVFAMVSRLPAGGFAGEGFGIVYLEANAHGVPVVAGNVGGATDAVVHGQTGLLVDPTDHVAVADALVRLLRDRELARRLGTAGRERARCYTWSKVAERVEDVLLEMMS